MPPKQDDALARARRAMADRAAGAPLAAASAPGRVNLIGDHIDYAGGWVLPAAIGARTACVATRAQDPSRSRVLALDAPGGADAAEFDARDATGGPARPGHWASYVRGVMTLVGELARGGGRETPNLDIVIASDVPVGAGLSSSAALEVSLATLLQHAWGLRLEESLVAGLCQRAEHEFAGVPCGLMDQTISVMGVAGHALAIDCATRRVHKVPLPDPGVALFFVIDTGARHALGASEYPLRRAAVERAAAKLGIRLLCEARAGMAEREDLQPDERRATRHVTGEHARVRRAVELLQRGGPGTLDELGILLTRSHESLRDDARVSCAELDETVGELLRLPGVLGARMTGGGFGGCVVALARAGAEAAVLRAFPGDAAAGRLPAFRVVASEGARPEPLGGAAQ